MYLLDTNTIIYFFKGMGNVAETLLSKSPKDVATTSITVYELEVGIAKSNNPDKRKNQLQTLLSHLTVLPFDRKEAAVAALIKAELEQSGVPIGPHDTLIAGIALNAKATLVTSNTKEFSRIQGLHLEDWFPKQDIDALQQD